MRKGQDFTCSWNGNSVTDTFDIFYGHNCTETEKHMFVNACWSDAAVGGVTLLLSFILMFIAVRICHRKI